MEAICKSQNGELENGMREMRRRRECEEWDGNAGAENQCEKTGNLGGNAKNVGNQGGNAGNQVGNLSIAVEITWNSNGNDKFKDWIEAKIINLVSRI